MENFELFLKTREGSRKDQKALRNHTALGVSEDARGIHVAWMYPDTLNLHGGRGDLMAIMQYCCSMNLPCEIRRINTLSEEIPFEWADLLYFTSGDLSVMEDVCAALVPQKAAFEAFAARGGQIAAIGSSGALLAEKTVLQNGHEYKGLGLLKMEFTQRDSAFGDDLWFTTEKDGIEMLGTQLQLADVKLNGDQKPFAKLIYGRGNCGDGFEGAETGGVFFTHCLGPILARNPKFAEALIRRCAECAGLDTAALVLNDDQIRYELDALADIRTFVDKKKRGEIRWKE